MNNICKSNIIYSDINIERKSYDAASRILTFVFSKSGVFSLIGEYIFLSALFQNIDPHICDTLECIAISKIRHYKSLIQLSELLSNGRSIKISSINRKHQADLNMKVTKNTLHKIIEKENKTIEEYIILNNNIKDKNINSLIEKIISDSKYHIDIIKSILK